MTPGKVLPIYSDREFDYVLEKHADQLVVICASSTDCGPCRNFEPAFEVCSTACERQQLDACFTYSAMYLYLAFMTLALSGSQICKQSLLMYVLPHAEVCQRVQEGGLSPLLR